MMPTLSDDDLNVLLEAVEAWEHKDAASEMFGDVLDIVAGPRDAVSRAHFDAERDIQKQKMAQARRARKERSVLLRAKLIEIRSSRQIDELQRRL